uniref:hypothetical protein n=1 Tax=Candidatus Electronema sp. TaxID=2698783 RepID=UPI004057CA4F
CKGFATSVIIRQYFSLSSAIKNDLIFFLTGIRPDVQLFYTAQRVPPDETAVNLMKKQGLYPKTFRIKRC